MIFSKLLNAGKTKCGWVLIWLLITIPCAAQTPSVAINEFMSSNGGILADEDGDYEDWIELYNYGEDDIDLAGWYLSDDYANPYRWEFPDIVLPAGEYLLVWASGKDRSKPGQPLHTNFSIDRDGEELMLTNPWGDRVDEVAPTPVERNWSYTRKPDGYGSWSWSENPTPLAPNAPHDMGSILVHYWLFTTRLSNNQPLTTIPATFSLATEAYLEFHSCLEGYPFDMHHPNWRKASMERRNLPTPLNYKPQGNDYTSYAQESVRGIQIKQPFQYEERENTLVFHAPTSGFKDVVFTFAVQDEGAAQALKIDYSVAGGEPQWITTDLLDSIIPLSPVYQLSQIDFRHIEMTSNNPHFKIRMRFLGDNPEEDNGHRVTFNNMSLEGKPLKAHYVKSTHGKSGMIFPFGFTRVFDGYHMGLSIFPSSTHVVDKLMVQNQNKAEEISYDANGVGFFELQNVKQNQHVHVSFMLDPGVLDQYDDKLLVYPNPAAYYINVYAHENIKKLKLADMSGRIVFENQTDATFYSARLGGLVSGMYVLIVTTENGTKYRKVQIIN